ncbi:hypothetical protein CPB85DRAFT_597298 [Mucidula mucida]|nr:hypothetical protein CPB85DRAFT_597298 [Mucidula mucida]
MSATTNDSDTPTTEDQKKRPRSPPDHSDILEALAELQYHLDDLPDDVVNEEMQLQLARLSAKLHRSPRREPIEIRDPFQRALYDLELRPERSLKIRTDNMKAISERSRALGNKHVINSEVFDGLVASLRNNFLDSPRSAPMLGRNLFASLGRDVFRVSPGRYIRDTSRLPELNPGHYTLQIQIYRYLCALLVFRNRRRYAGHHPATNNTDKHPYCIPILLARTRTNSLNFGVCHSSACISSFSLKRFSNSQILPKRAEPRHSAVW